MRLVIDREKQNNDRCSDSDTETFYSHTALERQPRSKSLQTFQQLFGISFTEELYLYTSSKDKLRIKKYLGNKTKDLELIRNL